MISARRTEIALLSISATCTSASVNCFRCSSSMYLLSRESFTRALPIPKHGHDGRHVADSQLQVGQMIEGDDIRSPREGLGQMSHGRAEPSCFNHRAHEHQF